LGDADKSIQIFAADFANFRKLRLADKNKSVRTICANLRNLRHKKTEIKSCHGFYTDWGRR
jgi:hypothetical protein